MSTTYKPSPRAEVVTRRTYSRPLDEEGGVFESWEQTVDRVIGHQRWLWERARDKPLGPEQEHELTELAQLFLRRESLPSGRTLWLGGTQVAQTREASQFNPLPLDTRVVTKGGVMALGDMDPESLYTVLTHSGKWASAQPSRSGERKMVEIVLRRGRTVVVQRSCVDHTWIVQGGKRVVASELEVGDKLVAAPATDGRSFDWDTASVPEQLWWCYGFVYGDGALSQGTSRVRLCGRKAGYLSRFLAFDFDHSFPPSCEEDPVVYTGRYAKTLPEDEAPLELKVAFLLGYFAADANRKNKFADENYIGISVSDRDAAEFVRTYAPAAGYYISSDSECEVDTNYGTRRATEFRFLNPSATLRWTVESVTPAPREECACLTVHNPDHSFILQNGIVSGNCSFLRVETVHDVVDAFWLLLQGCGVGFEPVRGSLSGFTVPKEVVVVRSEMTRAEWDAGERGQEENYEYFQGHDWTIQVGDSAEAWAKAVGKLLAGKNNSTRLILDFSQVRPSGIRLKGYGWISSGDDTLYQAMVAIAELLNARVDQMLSRMDVHDIMTHLGTTLSSRRSAEISLVPFNDPEWEEFAMCKKDSFAKGLKHRGQSNNSLVFYQRPSKLELRAIFDMIREGGGSEPGFINGEAAQRRAPWWKGANPCVEIALGNKGFCNLVTTDLGKFNGRMPELLRAIYLVSRANYRQTCVDLDDGILQGAWHENNEFLRLCGVSLTGIVKWEHQKDAERFAELRQMAETGVDSMSSELGLPRAKAVTTVKPEGTASKVLDTTEGGHKPLGRYIINKIKFGVHDPLLPVLREAGYEMMEDPYDSTGVLVDFPVDYSGIEFEKVTIPPQILDGPSREVEVNLESAIDQLERYKALMSSYVVSHNVSNTISYSPSEVPAMIEWIHENWEHYVGVSFLYRSDPTKTAQDLGYPYLPQQVVTKEEYDAYVKRLKPFDLNAGNTLDELEESACTQGVCPVR